MCVCLCVCVCVCKKVLTAAATTITSTPSATPPKAPPPPHQHQQSQKETPTKCIKMWTLVPHLNQCSTGVQAYLVARWCTVQTQSCCTFERLCWRNMKKQLKETVQLAKHMSRNRLHHTSQCLVCEALVLHRSPWHWWCWFFNKSLSYSKNNNLF